MPITLADFTDEELVSKGIDPNLRTYFLAVPTSEELMPTEYELEMFSRLSDWQEQSARSPIILGVPMESQYNKRN